MLAGAPPNHLVEPQGARGAVSGAREAVPGAREAVLVPQGAKATAKHAVSAAVAPVGAREETRGAGVAWRREGPCPCKNRTKERHIYMSGRTGGGEGSDVKHNTHDAW